MIIEIEKMLIVVGFWTFVVSVCLVMRLTLGEDNNMG